MDTTPETETYAGEIPARYLPLPVQVVETPGHWTEYTADFAGWVAAVSAKICGVLGGDVTETAAKVAAGVCLELAAYADEGVGVRQLGSGKLLITVETRAADDHVEQVLVNLSGVEL